MQWPHSGVFSMNAASFFIRRQQLSYSFPFTVQNLEAFVFCVTPNVSLWQCSILGLCPARHTVPLGAVQLCSASQSTGCLETSNSGRVGRLASWMQGVQRVLERPDQLHFVSAVMFFGLRCSEVCHQCTSCGVTLFRLSPWWQPCANTQVHAAAATKSASCPRHSFATR